MINDGTIECWGKNTQGELGDTTTTSSTSPVSVSGISTATQLDVGAVHNCALLSDATVKCWGRGTEGQLGHGSSPAFESTPVTVSGLTGVVSISAGEQQSAAVLNDGTAKTWGWNFFGMLGNGNTGTDSNVPVSVSSLTNVDAITVGRYVTCAVLDDGTGRCWGYNQQGQLGDGNTGTDSNVPVTVSGLSNAVSIASGGFSSCSTINDGTVDCWGRNTNGQLGDGTTTDSDTPVSVSGLSTVCLSSSQPPDPLCIEPGLYFHTCSILQDGTARCWGGNAYGQLGDASNTGSTSPVVVSSLTGAHSISSGTEHTCASMDDGTVKCWGRNNNGQLGDDSTTDSNIPVTVTGITDSVYVAACKDHSCSISSNGNVQCWGGNGNGQLGDGSTTSSNTPVSVSISGVIEIGGGNFFTCALISYGTIKCWGTNSFGQLGDASNTQRESPVLVSGISTAISLDVGIRHACAVLADGTARCWGRNNDGQLGDDSQVNSNVPVVVSGLTNAVSISTGDSHTCAKLSDGTAQCWGANNAGQLGDSSNTLSEVPVTVTGLTNVVTISVGGSVSCAVVGSGTAKCWGLNDNGQLGDQTTANKNTVVDVFGLTTVCIPATPSVSPTDSPTTAPTVSPTASPTDSPTLSPTNAPTASPTKNPSATPTGHPTTTPTSSPTTNPTDAPTSGPTTAPTSAPSTSPTTPIPSTNPTTSPSASPTINPTSSPTTAPTTNPTTNPTGAPSASPTTPIPTTDPTTSPSTGPTSAPTNAPSVNPTTAPSTGPTSSPTTAPSASPTTNPTTAPSASPTTPIPTGNPSAAPTTSPTVCGSSTQCGTNEICSGSSCSVVPCSDHDTCFGNYLEGRLPFCDFDSGYCVDLYTTDCTTLSDCTARARQKYIEVNGAIRITSDLDISDATKRKNATIELANSAISTNVEKARVLVSSVETMIIDNGVFITLNDDSDTLANICGTRCGDLGLLCNCQITQGTGSGNRRLLNDIVVTITWELDYDAYLELESSGTDFGDSNFTDELAASLGVDPNTITVGAVDGTIQLEIFIVDTDALEIGSVVSEMEAIESAVDATTSTLVSELGLDAGDIVSSELDLCADRNCTGRGDSTALGTNDVGCTTATGQCVCIGDYWGIDCQIACECENGGTCKNAYCVCEYPYYGQRCNQTVDCSC